MVEPSTQTRRGGERKTQQPINQKKRSEEKAVPPDTVLKKHAGRKEG